MYDNCQQLKRKKTEMFTNCEAETNEERLLQAPVHGGAMEGDDEEFEPVMKAEKQEL